MGCGRAKEEPKEAVGPTTSGRQAPNFRLSDLDGGEIELSSLRGKVVLVDFWATWCPPCREEIPHFRELYTKYKGKGLEVIGISLDQGGVSAVKSFAQDNRINYPLAMGNDQLVKAYGGIRGIPTTFLIDKKGQIAQKFVGYREKAVFEKEIQALLTE